MPYENLMPYIPLAQPQSLASLRERARGNRERFEQDELASLQAQGPNSSSIFGFGPELQSMHRRMQADTFANTNPSWDAWFQSVNEATGGKQGSGIIGPAMDEPDPIPSETSGPLKPNFHMRPSLEAVKAYRGYEGPSGEKRRRAGVMANQDQQAAQHYPKAGK